MIGRRFRALGWVAGIASAATCLYLTSLQVAAERAKLEGVEAKIVSARRDMRQLQTELGTRASLRQLERWNGDVLAMAAPRADQYLHGESELASVGSRVLRAAGPGAGASGAGAPVMLASAGATPVPGAASGSMAVISVAAHVQAPAVTPAAVATPAPRPTVQRVAFSPSPKLAAPKPKREAAPPREVAVAVTKPKPPKPKRDAAPVRLALADRQPDRSPIRRVLTRGALGDIARAAAAEGRRR